MRHRSVFTGGYIVLPIPNEDMLRAVTDYANAHGGFLHGKRRVNMWLRERNYSVSGDKIACRFGHLRHAAEEAGVIYAGDLAARNKAKGAVDKFRRWLRGKPDMGTQTMLWQYKEGNFESAVQAALKRYREKFGHDAVTINVNVCEDVSQHIVPEWLKCKSNQWIGIGYFLLGSE
ncbi:MAG: hypothetical protein WC822_06315 [Candidatus Paceibacterota bacterium]|jgi:hypothetical protein